jgi:hypothetical protein
MGGKTKGFVKTKSLGWSEGWVAGWWVDGRGGYRFSSHVKKKEGGKLRCLLLHRKKNFVFIFMM